MTLNDFEKIIEICYTKKVVVVSRRKKQVAIEQDLSAPEIAYLIATEFGFKLSEETDEVTDD